MTNFTIPKQVRDELKNVEQIQDKLGIPVDEGIRLTVAALRCNGFPTSASCAGHVDREGAGPYIDIQSPESTPVLEKLHNGRHEREEFTKNYEQLKLLNLQTRSKLYEFIEEFYKARTTPFRSMLTIRQRGPESTRLVCQMADVMSLPEREHEYRMWLKRAQAEMQAFGEFLCNKPFKD